MSAEYLMGIGAMVDGNAAIANATMQEQLAAEQANRDNQDPGTSHAFATRISAALLAIGSILPTTSACAANTIPSSATVAVPTQAPYSQPPGNGDQLTALVCEGFSVDAGRIVEHPIIENGDAEELRPVPKDKRTLPDELALGPPQDLSAMGFDANGNPTHEIEWYAENGKLLPEGVKPKCVQTAIKIVRIHTSMAQHHAGATSDPLHHVRAQADVAGYTYDNHICIPDQKAHLDLVHNSHDGYTQVQKAGVIYNYQTLQPATK